MASSIVPDRPILIVGAGPTGLTAALELARRDVPVRIVERREAPSKLSRAVGIMPNSMDILARSGLADAVRKEATEAAALHIHLGARRAATVSMVHPDPRLRLLCLPQDRTEAILAQGLSGHGVAVEYATSFEGLEQCGGHVRATVAGERRDYAYVLGADGAQSSVRGALGFQAEGYELDGEWSIADVDVPDWAGIDAFKLSIRGDGALFFLIPIGPARYRLVATVPDGLTACPILVPHARIRRTGDFRIAVRQVPSYGEDRVWLAGDAAHTHSPVGGRGMNLGVADAAEWAQRLMGGTLDRYGASRHAIGASTITFTERVRTMLMGAGAMRRGAIGLTARSIAAVPALRRRAVERMLTGEF